MNAPNASASTATSAGSPTPIVAYRKKQLRSAFLNDDGNAPPHVEALARDIEAHDARGSAGRGHQRRKHSQRRRLACTVGTEEAKDLPRPNFEAQTVDSADLGVAATAKGLHQVAHVDGEIWHRVFMPKE